MQITIIHYQSTIQMEALTAVALHNISNHQSYIA